MATRVRSFAKINLGLAVGPRRADGFHALTTVYQTLAAHDVVTVSARRAAVTRVRLTANHPGVPCTERGDAEKNTAYRIVAGALSRMGVAGEVTVDIDKRLPVQGGLGAGSANAAAALMGLERELGVALGGTERLELAAEIGSDVPLFLLGGTVLGLGRGEQVVPLPDLEAVACVVAVPGVGVSTRQAFAELDLREQGTGNRDQGTGGPGALTSAGEMGRLEKLSCAYAAVWTPNGVGTGTMPGSSGTTQVLAPALLDMRFGGALQSKAAAGGLAESSLLALVRTGIENDFEEVVFSQHPSLRSTKRDLMGSGAEEAVYAALSGSGSAVFGLYGSLDAARAAQQRVERSGTRTFLTETLPRSRYFERMFAE